MHRGEKDRSILGIARHVLHIINTHTQACIKDGAIHKIIQKKSLQIYKDASSLVWKLVSGWSASDCCYPSGDSFPLRPQQLGPPVPGAQRQVRRDVFFFFFLLSWKTSPKVLQKFHAAQPPIAQFPTVTWAADWSLSSQWRWIQVELRKLT